MSNQIQEKWIDAIEYLKSYTTTNYGYKYGAKLPGNIWKNGQVNTTLERTLNSSGASQFISGKNADNFQEFFANIVELTKTTEGTGLARNGVTNELWIDGLSCKLYNDENGRYSGFSINIEDDNRHDIFNLKYFTESFYDRCSSEKLCQMGDDKLDDREHIFVTAKEEEEMPPEQYCIMLNDDNSIDFAPLKGVYQVDMHTQNGSEFTDKTM